MPRIRKFNKRKFRGNIHTMIGSENSPGLANNGTSSRPWLSRTALGLVHLGKKLKYVSMCGDKSDYVGDKSVKRKLEDDEDADDPSYVSGGGKGAKSFVDRCVSYIGENAVECVKTNAFLNLPKDALVKLISSDCLALEEEDVWRCVLNWAKYVAGVTQPTAHWTEEERARVCQHLTGVINHVRLLLIDSQVFAEEVEPTGAVPMELSLERYRYAALPNKFRERSEDKRLQPRVSLKLFPGSQILIQEKTSYQRLLNQWYGSSKQVWRLVYRASSHGYSAEAFHRQCDGVAPTYVIVTGARGEVCGGFSDVPWGKTNTKSHYIPSDRAFLFTLTNSQDLPPTKYNIVKKPFAICYHPDCGPIFGAGADLLIASNCNTNMDSYSNLPHSYDGENASSSVLMGDYNFSVLDYEVFTPVGK